MHVLSDMNISLIMCFNSQDKNMLYNSSLDEIQAKLSIVNCQLKADRPSPRHYPHTPLDYRHTVKTPEPVMTTLSRTNKHTYKQTDGCYQVHYLPRFVVDKYVIWYQDYGHLYRKSQNLIGQIRI